MNDGPESGGFGPALGWMTDQLVSRLLPTDPVLGGGSEGATVEPAWGTDASSPPTTYWHWKHLWHLDRLERAERGEQAEELPTDGPLLSIVIPAYRPALWYFEECVESIIDQTYQRWELCLCDDGSGQPELRASMEAFAARDSRIKAMALEQNGGISRATNRALAAATGEFVILVDQDDLVEPDALAEIARVVSAVDDADVVYSDEDKLDEIGRPCQPNFKPDWDPELLLSHPYLGHLTAIRLDLLRRIGGFRPEFDGSQDFDVMLRSTELARRVVHIPKVLYHWRIVAGSAAGDPAAKPWAYAASRRVVDDAVSRRGIRGRVESGPIAGTYRVRREITSTPTVCVIIPFRDQAALTEACLRSLERSPGYPISEVLLVDNGSIEPETRVLRARLEARPGTRVLDYPGPFNWAAINNLAAAASGADMLLFLNNDIEATSEGWLHALVELGQRPEVGAVGARLLYPDGSLQHAGVVLGVGGIASHIFNGKPSGQSGYGGWDRVVRSYSALTAACMLVRREVFAELGGFDEALPVAYNDTDFCIRLGQAGYRLLYTPYAELIHYESVSRGLSGYAADFGEFLTRWWDLFHHEDPFYNPNLTRVFPWCSFRFPGEDEEWFATIGALVPPTVSEA